MREFFFPHQERRQFGLVQYITVAAVHSMQQDYSKKRLTFFDEIFISSRDFFLNSSETRRKKKYHFETNSIYLFFLSEKHASNQSSINKESTSVHTYKPSP